MIVDKIKRYVWLLDTIYRSGETGITFDEINEKWQHYDLLSEGERYHKRTFEQHKDEIQNIFNVEICCDRKTNRYYIDDREELRNNNLVLRWLINTFNLNNIIGQSKSLKDRIGLEEIPAGQEQLIDIIDRPSYSSLLLKVCEDKSYPLPKERLTPSQYAYITAKTGRNITPEDASAALVWAVNNESRWSFNFARNLQGYLIFRDFKYSTLGLTLWSLSKLGYSDIIIAFNEWIKQVIAKLATLKEINNDVIDKTIKDMASLLTHCLNHLQRLP